MEKPDQPREERGPIESLRALGTSFVELVRTRIELAVLELREETERRKEMVVLAAIAGVFLALSALLLALFVVYLFWDDHRVAAAASVTAIYFAIGAYALARLRRRMREAPPPFEATLSEFARDVEGLGNRHE